VLRLAFVMASPMGSMCEVCGKGFSKPANLKRHQKSHEINESKVYLCDVCDKSFARPDVRDRHVQKVHGVQVVRQEKVKSFPCTSCDKTFTERKNMIRHFRTAHEDEEVEVAQSTLETLQVNGKYCLKPTAVPLFTVPSVGKFSDTLSLLSDFEEEHCNESDVKSAKKKMKVDCPHCEATYATRSNLNRHIKQQHSDLPSSADGGCSIKCPKCEAKFAKLSLLGDHLEVEHDYVNDSQLLQFRCKDGELYYSYFC
jgi:uncharacterized Zn-finger protein